MTRDDRSVTAWSPAALVLAAAAALPAGVHAEEKPLWEFGLSLTTIYAPDYRGADEYRTLVLPFPFVIYRGERLRSDRDGTRAEILETDRLELNLSFGLGLPVRTDGNEARRGMPALDLVLEIGPAANITLARWEGRRNDLKLRLPVRAAFAIDGSPDSVGGVASPNLRLTLRDAPWAAGADVRLAVGGSFASRAYHRYYFGVPTTAATPTRPAYSPPGGYSGAEAGVSAVWELGALRVFAFTGVESTRGAAYEDSPLVKRKANASAGLGLAYVFGTSRRRVERDD